VTPERIEAGLAVSEQARAAVGVRIIMATRCGRRRRRRRMSWSAESLVLRIAYWQRSGAWTSGWREPGLPALIRISLTFAGDSAARCLIRRGAFAVVAMNRRQRGFALLIVLLTMGFLALIGTQLVAAARSDTRLANNLKQEAMLQAAADGRARARDVPCRRRLRPHSAPTACNGNCGIGQTPVLVRIEMKATE